MKVSSPRIPLTGRGRANDRLRIARVGVGSALSFQFVPAMQRGAKQLGYCAETICFGLGVWIWTDLHGGLATHAPLWRVARGERSTSEPDRVEDGKREQLAVSRVSGLLTFPEFEASAAAP